MSLALARKYRPKKFADVAVQEHVARTLVGAVKSEHVAHAYLFCGPRGTGKTTLARVLAMSLNCEHRVRGEGGEPCGDCLSCTRIWTGATSMDVVEIDAASNRGVDDARELREKAMYAPAGEYRYKVYIVDEAHMLTKDAWNALLKILEEPPPRVVFVFATTEPQKIAQAAAPVLSRVQRFDLKRIGAADVRARLAYVLHTESVTITPDALGMLARAADGSMRDALSLTDQVLSLGPGVIDGTRVRDALGLVHEDEYLALLDVVAERRAGDVFTSIGRLADQGIDFGVLLSGFADLLRAQLAITLGGTAPDLSETLHTALVERKDRLAAGDLLRMLSLLMEMEPHFRRSAQQQLLLETMLVRFALLDRTVNLEDVLKGVAASPCGTGGGGTRRQTDTDETVRIAPSRLSGPGTRGMLADAAPTAPRVSEPAAPSRRVAPPAVAAPIADAPIADAAPVPAKKSRLDLNHLVERWDDIVEAVRASGRTMVASALGEATPIAVTGQGVITIGVTADAFATAITNGSAEIVAAMERYFDGVARIVPTMATEGKSGGRLTADDVIADRVARLRKRDPVLDAAIDVLDLRLVD